LFVAAVLTEQRFSSAQSASTTEKGTASMQREMELSDFSGSGDWHLDLGEARAVQPLDRLEFSLDVQVESFDPAAEIFACIRVQNSNRHVVEERFAPVAPDYARKDRQALSGRFVVPANGAFVNVRLWGQKAARVLAGRPAFNLLCSLAISPVEPIALSNTTLQVTIHPNEWRFEVCDRRSGHDWQTFPAQDNFLVTGVQHQTARTATFSAVYLPEDAPLFLTVALDAAQPQFSIHAAMSPLVRMPSWAATLGVLPAFCEPSPTAELVVPLGEGFLYPTNRADIPSHLLQLSDGSGLTMPWFGIADRKSGAAAMCFTADDNDALARLHYRSEGQRAAGTVKLDWMSQRGQWGYDRTATFWFADDGGYVALAKRYRREAALTGKLVTLAEKSKLQPRIANLLGAPNCWFNFLWHMEKPRRMEALRWFHERGMNRLLLSNSDALDDTSEVDSWGWLTGQYDLYSDVWPPHAPKKQKARGDTFGYPDSIQVRYTGEQVRGWVHKTEEGEFPGYVLCPTCHAEWAQERVPPTLAARKQTSRLIDVTAATALGECFHPEHPMSRADDKAARVNLLRYMSNQNLVVGSEMGVDWAIPYICYSEGMLSPVPYRHPEAGYLTPGMQPVEDTMRYQLNPAVRAPLWELVFRDCSVSYWYWGDASNTFPELWPRRNAFNALYATPPLYMILTEESMYLAQRERILATDEFLKPIFAAVEFSKMTDHRFLSEDRLLQQSVFTNGATITVNFAESPREYGGTSIPALGYHLQSKNSAMTLAQNMEE
jgi:hypothetical protein